MYRSLLMTSFVIIVSGCSVFGIYPINVPIEHACISRNISGCSDLTDSVIQYVNGNYSIAKQKMINAVNENDDAKSMVAYSDALDILATEYESPNLHTASIFIKRELARKVSASLAINKTEKATTQLDKPEIVVKIVQPQIILVCSDPTCTKYASVQQAIMCVDNQCSKWIDPFTNNPSQVMDTRK